ncbi:hypothetical protein B0H13DRAFT_1888570 [Mycena leptocephala]|nr:hypothetical protein B0H13DRAFT_1888570 [Mycena leptocephala]
MSLHHSRIRTPPPESHRRAALLVRESQLERETWTRESWVEVDRPRAVQALRSYTPRRLATVPEGLAYLRSIQHRDRFAKGLTAHKRYSQAIDPEVPEPQFRKRVVYSRKRKAPDVAKDLIDDPPSSILQDTRSPRTTAVGPARSSTLIRATREGVLHTPTRARLSKPAATRRVSAPDPTRSPPPRAYWMGDNQRSVMQDQSSARTRIRRRKSEPSHPRVAGLKAPTVIVAYAPICGSRRNRGARGATTFFGPPGHVVHK